MNRALILLLISFFGFSAFSQVRDSFEDVNFTNPNWFGDTTKFGFSNGKLTSSSTTIGDVFYISTPQNLTNKHEWRLWLDLNFNTSSANYVDFFLASDSQNLKNCQNGLYLRIGNTKDELALYAIDNGTHLLLADGHDKQTERATINLKIEQDTASKIYADFSGGTNFSPVFSHQSNIKGDAKWCGILIQQSTSSFFGKHSFDDFYSGPVQIDTIAPVLLSHRWKDNQTLELTCSEPILVSNQTKFELLPTYGTPIESNANAEDIELIWPQPIANGNYDLTITNLLDLEGNQLDTSFRVTFFQAPKPSKGDIIISEIMADPTPPAGLPEVEYIEIWNVRNTPFDLSNLVVTDGSSSAEIINEEIGANQHVIVCKTGDGSALNTYGKVLELSDFPTLNNSGDQLQLLLNGNILDEVSYTNTWYDDPTKEDGGYALELIDTGNTCPTHYNWKASQAAIGGTPAMPNSSFGTVLDSLAPKVLALSTTQNKLILTISEDAEELINGIFSNFMVAETLQQPIAIAKNASNQWELEFTDTFEFNTIYYLDILHFTDCRGNDNPDIKIPFVRLLQPKQGEVLINEVLFNPRADAYDFIELRNSSNNILDIGAIQLARYNDSELQNISRISDTELALFPGEYIALTEDSASLRTEYNTGDFIVQTDIPPMNNDEGTLVLLNNDGLTLDSLTYFEEQHFELLNSVDGVSLERISFSAPTYQPTNWASASSSVGFATPALPNSQALDNQTTEIDVAIANPTFSPDGDGYQDVLGIQYKVDEPGYVANIFIYSLNGSLIHQPISNETLATKGVLLWDGILNNGEKIRIGHYIALVEIFNLDGKKTKKKLAFSVVGQF